MSDVLRLLFRFSGRINRLQFWMGWLVLIALAVVAGGIEAIVELGLGYRLPAFDVVRFASIWLFIASSVALMAKRLNDLGWPTWIVYPAIALSVLPGFALPNGLVSEGGSVATLLFWGQVVAFVAVFLPCAFLRGAGAGSVFEPRT